MISVDLSRVSAYRLREAHADGRSCTAEVAIALLNMAGDTQAAGALGSHFSCFRERYLAGEKPFIRGVSQQQRQKAFKIIRSLAFTGGLHEPREG
ncbi:hypothetical protein ACNKHO_16450 [Shigella flexneri]